MNLSLEQIKNHPIANKWYLQAEDEEIAIYDPPLAIDLAPDEPFTEPTSFLDITLPTTPPTDLLIFHRGTTREISHIGLEEEAKDMGIISANRRNHYEIVGGGIFDADLNYVRESRAFGDIEDQRLENLGELLEDIRSSRSQQNNNQWERLFNNKNIDIDPTDIDWWD